jgi:uncharacterized protein (DUF1800 family)
METSAPTLLVNSSNVTSGSEICCNDAQRIVASAHAETPKGRSNGAERHGLDLMPLSPLAARNAMLAHQRFGMGAKPGGIARIAADPKAALRAEVNTPGIALIRDPSLPTYVEACGNSAKLSAPAHEIYLREINARVDKHMAPDIGFVERLVVFWSNHFSLSVQKHTCVRGTVGQLERDVIRKHVLGKFSDMLFGVMRHPAMIVFLDNQNSVGPNTWIGRNRKLGLNENLAREVMELYTVGVGGGYTEADVREFAKILTGWSYVSGWQSDKGTYGGTKQNCGQFIYRGDWHEPGAFKVMGRTYAQQGQAQGDAVLLFLAKHPATAQHIAFKLLRHFVTDNPTPTMVRRIAEVFTRTGGNLKSVALALINTPEAWTLPLSRIRTPYELAIAQFRALETRYLPGETFVFTRSLRSLQQMIWDCDSVEGYSDETPAWLNADGMRLRLDTALAAAVYYGERRKMEAPALARALYDSALSPETLKQILAAGNGRRQLAVLFSSPEFQRR